MSTESIDTNIDTVFEKMCKGSSVKVDKFQSLMVTFKSTADSFAKLGCSLALAAIAMLTTAFSLRMHPKHVAHRKYIQTRVCSSLRVEILSVGPSV